MALQSIEPRLPVNSPNRSGGDTAIAGAGGITGDGGEQARLERPNTRGRRVPRKVRSAHGRLTWREIKPGTRAAGGKPN
jgi:hypothetical protein